MFNQESDNKGYSVLVAIVNRGKGSKLLEFGRSIGAIEASCLLGSGTIPGHMIQLMGLNEVRKEVVLLFIPAAREEEILVKLNKTFQFYKPNHGIAFTVPLAGIMQLRQEESIRWLDDKQKKQDGFSLLLLIVDKGKAENIIEFSQAQGYYGGTIIKKARGAAGDMHMVLDMQVQTEKEIILMLLDTGLAHKLADLLKEELKLNQANTGILIMSKVNHAIGLYQDKGGNI